MSSRSPVPVFCTERLISFTAKLFEDEVRAANLLLNLQAIDHDTVDCMKGVEEYSESRVRLLNPEKTMRHLNTVMIKEGLRLRVARSSDVYKLHIQTRSACLDLQPLQCGLYWVESLRARSRSAP